LFIIVLLFEMNNMRGFKNDVHSYQFTPKFTNWVTRETIFSNEGLSR
jgi:hypothetical protein